MSKYTTGELAKLCGVTVRTVQYYDTRGILIPSELSEGGRRLYSEDDLKRMKVICFLRELDLPIDAISQILKEEHPEKVISLLIEQQESVLSDEISEKQEKLEKLRELKNGLKTKADFSLETIGTWKIDFPCQRVLMPSAAGVLRGSEPDCARVIKGMAINAIPASTRHIMSVRFTAAAFY